MAETIREPAHTVTQRFDLAREEHDGSPLGEPEGVLVGDGQRRDVVQRGLDRE